MSAKIIDITTEVSRTYHYRDGDFTITSPTSVHVMADDSGITHRVVAADGRTYRPERGWLCISWLPRDGSPPFVA